MNTKILTAVVVLVILSGIGYLTLQKSQTPQPAMMKEETEPSQTTMMNDDGGVQESPMMKNDVSSSQAAMMPKDTQAGASMMDEKNGKTRYVPYTKEAFETVKSPRRVLFFYANWCPTCTPVDADFQATSEKIPQDVTVFRVNYSDTDTDKDEKALAATYGVTYQHTFVQIDQNGKELTKWNGGNASDLLTKIQ